MVKTTGCSTRDPGLVTSTYIVAHNHLQRWGSNAFFWPL